MNIIVCLKIVPRPEEVKVDPKTNLLDRARARNVINPSCMNALEAALSLKSRYGGQVKVLSMGPPFAKDFLKLTLAMGADSAYLLSDRAFGGADTLATSYALARGIEKLAPYELILCGEESSDGATAQVPPGIAEWLDISQITYGAELELTDEGKRVVAKREIRGGYQKIAASLPCVVSLKVGSNEPRFFDFEKLKVLNEASVTVWNSQDLNCEPALIGQPGSPTSVAGVKQVASSQRRREFIQGSPEEIARELFKKLYGG